MKLLILMVTLLMSDSCAMLCIQSHLEEDVNKAIGAVLEATSESSCSLILLTEGTTSSRSLLKAESSERFSSRGVTVMEVTENGQDSNVSQIELSQLIGQARLVRMRSWCVIVVLVSHDPTFLAAFAESSLKGRLLVWATRLLVVTSLTLPQLYDLLPSHWTFSMMNTIFLNLEDTSSNLRYSIYTYLPYSPHGAQMMRLAIWSLKHGMVHLANLSLFPDKFSSFHGAKINVTGLPWPPYWDEEEEESPDGTVVKKYSGSDYLALLALAEALNFTINLLHIPTWAEAAKSVGERKIFFIAVNHYTLPERLKVYDYTHAYEFSLISFSLVKPGIKPRWQSLYYPLTDQVWAVILAILIVMPSFFYLVCIKIDLQQDKKMSVWTMVLEVMGMLVGQNLPLRFPDFSSSRLLVAAWLVFSFIIGVAYRGNLTAALTLPKFPPRPETVEQLVSKVDRVTVPPLGRDWKKFLSVSQSKAFRKLSELMLPGPTIQEGLLMATKQNTAQVTDRRNLAYTTAKYFTKVDGSSQLYIGREPIFPVPAAIPVPHDAPFKPQLDMYLMAVVESGLLRKWVADTLREPIRRSQRRQREKLSKKPQQAKEDNGESGSNIKALTLTHMQGPLMLLLLGLVFAGIIYIGEIFVIKCRK